MSLQLVEIAVKDYCFKYLHPNLPLPIIWPPHTMTSWYATPESAMSGCYVFYTSRFEILYIGSTTLNIGGRLAKHDHQKPIAAWRQRAANVQLITMLDAHGASGLEQYLIQRLQPIGNKHGLRP